MELVCVYNEGWLKGTRREEVICTGEILITDVLSIKSDALFSINLNFKYTEYKKKTSKLPLSHDHDMSCPRIKVKIRHLSTLTSLFAPSYDNYIEGVPMDTETYVKQYFKLSIRRTRRIITYINLFLKDLKTVLHYKYPFFSYCCLIVRTSSLIVCLCVSSFLTFLFLRRLKISLRILSSLWFCLQFTSIHQ